MKLIVLADLHYGQSDEQNQKVIDLSKFICSANADGIVFCGDICNDIFDFLEPCFSLFNDFRGFKCAIPGNHDLFSDKVSTEEIYYSIFPDKCIKHNVHPIHINPYYFNDSALCGTIGWYDGSFKDDSCYLISNEEYHNKTLSTGQIWQDKIYIDWKKSDIEQTRILTEKLNNQLKKAQQKVNNIQIFSHHLLNSSLLLKKPYDPLWSFKRYFMGSDAFLPVIDEFPEITNVYSGHCHLNLETVRQRVLYKSVYPF